MGFLFLWKCKQTCLYFKIKFTIIIQYNTEKQKTHKLSYLTNTVPRGGECRALLSCGNLETNSGGSSSISSNTTIHTRLIRTFKILELELCSKTQSWKSTSSFSSSSVQHLESSSEQHSCVFFSNKYYHKNLNLKLWPHNFNFLKTTKFYYILLGYHNT